MISFSSSYSQNFDSLANSGGNNIWANDVTLPGWSLFRQPSTSPVAITAYGASNGSANGGSFYSYGSMGSSDRAIGGLGSNANSFGAPSSNNLAGWIALTLTNDSGSTINALDLSFNGEQWRNGGNASAQSMVLEYGFGSTFATVSNWIAPGGNFNWTSPVTSATAAAIDGNIAGNGGGRVSNRGGSLQNLGWLANGNLWFRWIETNDSGNDHGLAIDDLSINLGASLPVVTISSPDAAAAEQGGDIASLRISRDGSSAAALSVNLNLAGSASLNSDYSLSTSTAGASISGSTALIPEGQSWLDVIITPINDSLIEGGETVQLSLASSSNYASGSPVSATVSIADDDEGAGSIQITEYMYNGAGGLGEFIEFTNLSSNAVNMAGWSFDDNSRTPGSQDLSGFGIVNPGESVILTESTAAAFRSVWSLADNVKVIGGSTNNLGRNDEINLYDASGALVDRLSYNDQIYVGTIRTENASGWAPTGKLANFVISTDWKLASLNDGQNSRSSSGADLGNPGHFNGGGAGVLLIQSGGGSSLVEGGATDTISLALRSQPSADVVIELNGGSQLSPSIARASFTSANWSTAQSISLSAIDDLFVEGSHSGSLSFGVSSADASYGGLAIAPLSVAIADNDLIGPPPSIAEATAHGWIDLPATGAGGWLSGVIDDPTDPARSLGIDFYLADLDTPLANLQLGVSSSNQAVVSNANLMLSGSGANRKLQITPSGAGLTTITVTVADGSSSASYEFSYGASAASALPANSRFHTGASDASSAIAIDANWMLVADDEDQILRLYSRQQSGLPQAGFDFSSSLGLAGGSEVDLEASTRIGNTIYWLGSHGNNTSGTDRPNRERLFATALSGSGSDTSLSFLGDYRYLEDDLLAWDAANGNALGLAASAAAGVLPEQAAGFNIEGLCIAPDGSSAYLAFRAPNTAPNTASGASGGNQRALIIPVTNFTSLVAIGGGSPGAAQFGNPISLDLGGRGIRSIEANASGEYLIVAGPSGAATGIAPADFRLFSWSGNAADAPVLRQADLSTLLSGGSFEAIVEVPNALNAGSSLQLLSDNGDTVWYGNGVISKDLEIGAGFGKPLQKFRSDWLSLGPAVIPTGSIALSSSYSQNFNGLINSGSPSWSDNQIPGWHAARSGSGSTIVAGSGSSNSGNLYSFGVDGSTDRALGSVGSNGAGNFFWGARFHNDTGRSLDTLYLSYRGEQWRNSGEASSQALELQWRIGGTGIGGSSLADTGWTSAPQLGFSAPVSGGAAGALNGNLAANSRQLSGSLSGLGLAAGQDLWLRWSDPNHSGADHGLAIDDLVVSSSPLPAVRIIPSGADTSVSETGPSSDSIALALSTNPSSPVSVTLTADSQVQISADGSNFSSSLTLVLSDTNPRSVTVRAIDDELLETAIHAGTIRARVSSADPAYDGMVVSDLGVQITDNEQLVVVTAIHSIQGSGATSPMLGQRKTVEGVVVASFPGSNGLNGFYLQEEDADADSDPTSSEGIFVSDPNGLFSGAVGSRLRLTGTVAEYSSSASAITGTTVNSSLTQLTNISGLNYLGSAALPSITRVTLPVADAAALERYEGMRLQVAAASGDLVVTDTFGLGRYGEVGLSAGGRLTNYTQNNNPSVSGYAAYRNDLLDNYITLDDGSSVQNPATVIHGRGGNPLSASNTLRGGDSIVSITGVLDERFDGYRIQTSTGADFSATNPRSDAPASLGGSLRVASFNLLNFFNGNGSGGGFPTSRGADSAYEYTRQFDKTLEAILGFDADILGYNEIENDGYGANSAVAAIVNGLNNVLGANLYGYVIPRSADLNLSGGFGGDEITVGFLYRTDKVRLAAGSQVAALQSGSFSQAAARVQRPALAASFERIEAGAATGEQFTAVVTHLKSKGSSAGGAGDADAGDGQGLSNGSRSRAASEMADWLASSPTGSSDPDVLILGDLNSYLQEDPIRILANRGYRSLFDADSYSYQFNGQWGSLDHMLASDSLYSQVSGSAKWHINSDEPIILDYNTEFKSVAQQTNFYNEDPFRTSDHDPLLAGLSLTPANRTPTHITSIGGGDSVVSSQINDNSVVGTAEASRSVSIYTGATLLGTTTSDSSGNFSYTLTAPNLTIIGQGSGKSITASLTGAAGSTGTSSTFSFSIDTLAPAVSSFAISDGALQIGDTATVTLAFSEAVAGFDSDADITAANAVLSAMSSADGGLTWTGVFTPIANIEDTTNILILANTYTDLAGNAGVTASTANYSIDTLAPATTAAVTAITDDVGIVQGTVASGATTDDISLSISGTLSAALAAGEAVRLYDGTTYLGNATVSGTTWSYADSRVWVMLYPLNHFFSYTAQVSDAAGNQSAAGSVYTATFDQVAPSAPTLTLTSDTGSSSTDRLTNNGSITVVGLEAGATWQYSTNRGTSWSAALAATTTAFSVAPGSYSPAQVQVRQIDAAGNSSPALTTFPAFTVDTIAPNTTATITAVNDNVGLIRGNLADGASTDDTTPTISGTISAALASGETLRLFNGDTLLGIASVNNTAKTWSFTPAALAATAGTSYSITARVADAAGNLGTASTSFSFSLDTSAPAVTAAITAVDDNVGLIQGNLVAYAVSDDTTPTITGSITAALATGESLRIFNGSTFLGLATVDNATLTWAFTPTTALPITTATWYGITARVADAAGNLGSVSATRYFGIDTTAPISTAAITAVNDNVGLIRGNLADGASTDDTTPTISGTISAALASGETLRLFNGDTLLGIASVNNTAKTWSFTPAALAATAGTSYSITARVADAAGNLGTASTSFSFSLDTSAPAVTAAITAVDDNVGLIQGNLVAYAVSDDTTPTITGSITAALATGESLRIFNGSTFLGLATVDNATLTWAFTPTTALPITTATWYGITARVADAAGNLGSVSATRYFGIDTTAPSTTAAITAVNDNVGLIRGNLVADAVSDDTTPTISGTISAALATGERLRIYNGDSYLGIASVNNTANTWSFTPSTPIGNGFYAVSARVSDGAGNLGAASPVQRFSIDSTANQLIGTAAANTLTATNAKDLITGLGGIDTFKFTALTSSTLASFDRITDFNIGTDILDGPNAITAAEINKLGLADSLDASSISTLLTTSTFIANKAASFSYSDPSGVSRSFIALNDGIAGYQSSADTIIEITGYTGLLANLFVG